MSRPLGVHDQLVVQHHGPQQILTATLPHMTNLARILILHIPPLLTRVALDVVDEGEVTYYLEDFRQMPLIDIGPLTSAGRDVH